MEHRCRWLGFIFCFGICTAQLSLNLTGQPNDMVVTASSNVFVSTSASGSGRVYRLNGSLVQQEVVQFPSGTTVLRMALSSDQSKLIVSVSNGSCIVYNASNLDKPLAGTFKNVQAVGNNKVALVSAPVSGGGNSFYVGSSNGTVNLIGQYGLDRNLGRTSGNLFSVTANPFNRDWYGGFVAGSYAYFVVMDLSATSAPIGVRVVRVCDNSNGTSISAMYEVYLDCLSSYDSIFSNARITGASLVSYPMSPGGPYEDTIVIGMVSPPFNAQVPTYRSRVCAYSLSQINAIIDNSSSNCSSQPLPWLINQRPVVCSTPCNLSSPGAIEALTISQASFIVAALAQNTSFELSYSLVFNIEGLTVLFLASTNKVDQLGKSTLQAFNITGGSVPIPGIWFSTWLMPGPVTRLTWTSGQNFVYAITNTSVVQVPIELCSNFTDCQSCAANVNPLCGWCTVEQKCSRRSLCQNSSVSGRWVQGSTSQCISITSVAPTKFISEMPTNINVTVTSGLPSPLTGESFMCLLSTGSGKYITVPFSNISQNAFTANISGAISQQNVPKLVVTFSFASSLLSIPFTISSINVTAYNCMLFTSCSSCLQSDGVCRWCNVEKRCTAVTSSCSNAISVNPASNQTYLDVCPTLLNGTYLLPVSVSRPLVLNTKNLLQLISGYSYICNVTLPKGPIVLPATYISNTSIRCMYTAAQISIPVGTTSMVANVSLIWTNNSTVMYQIDPLGVIQVSLYSCSKFSVSSCTSCLAINIGTGYDCGWCDGTSSCVELETCTFPSNLTNQSNLCPSPVLNSVSPSSGPFGGGTRLTITGTNLGVTVGDIFNVTVGGLNCSVQSDEYIAGTQIVCMTGNYSNRSSGGTPVNLAIQVYISGSLAAAQSNLTYILVNPSISSVFPKSGPIAGGTNVTIEGTFLNVGNGVKKVLLNGAMCKISQISLYQIACTSSALYVAGVGMVTVYIDNDVAIDNQVTFEYTSNPNYTSVFPARTIPAGGILLTFTGTYLNVSQKALLIINGMMAPCNQTFTTLKCYAPSLSSDPTGPNVYLFPDFNYTIVMDGAPGPPQKIEVVPNPKFTSINLVDQNQIIGSVRSISIMGTNVRNVELTEINVAVGGEKCAINPDLVTTSALSCIPPNFIAADVYNVTVLVGMNLLHNVGFLKYISSGEYRILNAVFPVAAVAGGVGGGGALVVVVLVVIVTISVMVHGRSSKRKNAQVTSLLMQMESMENAMAEECKRAFAELQIDLHDVANVEDKNYPFWDFRTFAIRFLFPTASDDHIVLKPVQFHTGLEEKSGLKQLQKFNHLLLDKEFLLTMIRTLEAQPGYFTLQDRCNFASMLIIVLQHELPYATDILTSLLSDLLQHSASKSNPKLLLRRTESVAEKLLGNWLCFLLFPFILDHIGEPLFTLFRAIKNQLEKGPVDAITGEARNSLSEDKLLRLQLDVNVVEAIVDTENNDVIPIKLLASDTITQTKEKILDALFKNCPASKRPQLTDVDLQLKRGNAAISLCDQDESSERDGNWTKLNTLGHYKLDQMSELHLRNPKSPQPHFSLVPRHEYPVRTTSSDTIGTVICNMTVPSSEMSESCRVYHLIKPESAQSSLEGEQSHGNLVPEAFLTRLLATKRIIQPFVDDLFNAVFCIPRRKPLPKAVKYLFDFLDLQAADMGITDPEVVHTWKTNSLTLHFWVNVIVNPDFVFDIYKSTTVHSCLSVISRAYIDACSTSDINYSKDTSSSKLLYVNEVKGYKSHVQQYYNTIQSEPKMEKGELEDYIKESTHTTHQHFVTESALYELAKYGIKYSAQLSAALDENGLTDTAQTFKDIVKGLSP